MPGTDQQETAKKSANEPVGKTAGFTFRATIFAAGKTVTGIEVPGTIVAGFGAGKRPPVKVTINGYAYRSTVAVYGGVYMIGISAAVRGQAGVNSGDAIDVHLELDTERREVVVPPDFAKALGENPVAKQFFSNLSYSTKNGHVLSIEQAKTDETRRKRIDKAIDTLNKRKK